MTPDQIRIAPDPLVSLSDGREIYSVIEDARIITGTAKDGSKIVSHVREGAFVLTSPDGKLIVGPIDPDKALDLAASVCLSDPLGLTGSQHIHILATALLGLAACFPADPEPAGRTARTEAA